MAQKGYKMRCQCCNASLNDYESTMRHAITKQFVEVCLVCMKTIDAYIPLQVRNDLLSESDTGNVDTLWDNVEDYIDDTSEDDGIDDYWAER
jgi:hypothetical protein